MQSRLPDLNSSFVKHRTNALSAFSCGDYSSCVISLDAIIALLPDEYRVEINSEKYREILADRKTIDCNKCKTENILNDVKQYDLELGWMEQILSDTKTQRIWICTKCETANEMQFKKIKIVKYNQPYYLGVIPSPPQKRRGITGRNTFDNEFAEWFDIAIKECENKIMLFRSEYANQQTDGLQLETEE